MNETLLQKWPTAGTAIHITFPCTILHTISSTRTLHFALKPCTDRFTLQFYAKMPLPGDNFPWPPKTHTGLLPLCYQVPVHWTHSSNSLPCSDKAWWFSSLLSMTAYDKQQVTQWVPLNESFKLTVFVYILSHLFGVGVPQGKRQLKEGGTANPVCSQDYPVPHTTVFSHP